jgi:quercetin 2,3-dioxygenase
VGPWCFIDHYGPVSVDGTAGMDVPPHPHIGLQTVTWLISGEVLHRDSLGSEQLIRPGQLNLMTAGRGIAHAEESLRGREADPRNLPGRSTDLHGVQLWTALPDASRQVAPAFEHHAELPVFGSGGLRVTVFLGALGPVRSPATVFWPGVGAEIAAGTGAAELGGTGPAGGPEAAGELPLPAGHEHVMFVSAGSAQVAGTVLSTGELLYLPPGGGVRAGRQPAVPARRPAAWRRPADVVELRGPHAGGDRRGDGAVGGRRVRHGAGLPRCAAGRAGAGRGPAAEAGIFALTGARRPIG